ncbi:MAG: tetratricopeptide repeat protein [Pirellulales bacterium]|nr:tetratricopeptide repeat protein [Pirellulales bacterium]
MYIINSLKDPPRVCYDTDWNSRKGNVMKVFPRARLGSLLIALGILAAGLAPSQCFSQDKTEAGTREYRAAAGLQKSGEYELAAQAWNEFLQNFGRHSFATQAKLNLGICYLKNDKSKQAAATLEALVAAKPPPEVLEVALLYLGVSQYNLARGGDAKAYAAADVSFAQLLEKFAKSKYAAQAIFYRGECLYAMGKKPEAAGFYARLLKEHPKSSLVGDALYALGVTREELGQWEAAGESYDEFIKRFAKSPLYVEVTMRRGETLFGIKEYAAAAEWFAYSAGRKDFALADHSTMRQAASLAQLQKHAQAGDLYASVAQKFPESKQIEEANLAGGKCYYLAGDMSKAEGLLRKVLDAGGKSSPEAAHWLARSLLKQKKPAEAVVATDKALPKAGKGPWAAQLSMDRADALYEIPKRRGEAIAAYEMIARKYPQDAVAPSALYMAAFTALEAGDYQKATVAATDFLKKFPKDKLRPDVLSIAAESNLQLGKLDQAEKFYGELLDKYPKSPDAQSWKVRQGLAVFLQKKFARAVELLQPRLAEIKDPAALAEAQYIVGSSQAEQKQYAAAIKSLEASLAADPSWRQADDTLLVLADAHRQQNNLDEAIAACRRLIEKFPNSRLLDRANYWLGEYLYAKGDFKAAVTQYKAVIDKWPKSSLRPHALYGLAWAQLSLKDWAGVEKTVDQLLNEFPKSELAPRARYARGTARQQLGKNAEAVDDIRAMLESKPSARDRSDAMYVMGLAQAGMKKHSEAAATFEKLLADNPQYAGSDKTLYELGWSLKASGGKNSNKAIQRFAQLAKRFPKSPLAAEALYHVGEDQYAKKQYADAAASYHQSAQKATDKVLKEKAYHKLGWAYFNDGKLDDARQTFDFQRKTFSNGKLAGDATFMLGECLYKTQKHAKALAAFEKVGKTTGKDFAALALLHGSQSAAQLKQWEKCRSLAARAAKDFPDSTYLPEMLCEQGWALQNLGKSAEAAKLYESVLQKTDREVAARAQFLLGEILFADKNYAEAIKTFSKVIYGYSYPRWQADATYEAARCFETLGKKKQALGYYTELVTRYPKSDKAAVAKKRLEELGE